MFAFPVGTFELATPEPDRIPELVAMFERCSAGSRYARFLSPVAALPPDHVNQVVSPRRGDRSWAVAAVPSGSIVGLASLFLLDEAHAELGLLVEDAYQRHGMGTFLLATVIAHATKVGLRGLHALVLSDSRHVRRMLERHGEVVSRAESHTTELSLMLRPDRCPT